MFYTYKYITFYNRCGYVLLFLEQVQFIGWEICENLSTILFSLYLNDLHHFLKNPQT